MGCHRSGSVLNFIAFILLLITAVIFIVSFWSPYWIHYPLRFVAPNLPFHFVRGIASKTYPFKQASYRGLLAVCYRDGSCMWFWEEDNRPQDSLPGWYKATQGLFATGIALLIATIVFQFVYTCCFCKRRQRPTYQYCMPPIVGGLTLLAGLLVGISLAVYSGSSNNEGEFNPEMVNNGGGGFLDWGFYVGIAGICGAILTATLFFVDGCLQAKNYRGYSEPPSVSTIYKPNISA